MIYTLDIIKPHKLSYEDLKELNWPFDEEDNPKNLWDYDDFALPKIEINSLDELMDFINKYGEVVVFKDKIEIYNSYRE